MLDELNKRPGADAQLERASRPEADASPVGDREVPLLTGNPYAAMHRWLDGEATLAEANRGEAARYVELWRRIGAESDRVRHAKAPAGLTDRIMAALPDAAPAQRPEMRMAAAPLTLATATAAAAPAVAMPVAPAATAESSWWQRPVEMNPGVALVAAAGLVALGAVLGSALRGQ